MAQKKLKAVETASGDITGARKNYRARLQNVSKKFAVALADFEKISAHPGANHEDAERLTSAIESKLAGSLEKIGEASAPKLDVSFD